MAEPAADIAAVTFTAILFSVLFKRALRGLKSPESAPANGSGSKR